jgi:hypothetical protein
MAAAVTVSVAGVSYAAFDPKDAQEHARQVAGQATCRAVDAAIVAYVTVHDEAPASIDEVAGYVDGDITAYRIVDGVAVGPGC